jgi:hypothetical protein
VQDADGLCLFVWMMYTRPGAGRPYWDEMYDKLETLAAAVGAKRIRMHSPRKGWQGSRERFALKSYIYEYEVAHG